MKSVPFTGMIMQTTVHSIPMAHPGDVSGLVALIECGAIRPKEIVAVIGKTEGNGGVNDFTRGYFTQTLMNMLSGYLGISATTLIRTIPCVLSGGTEGVLSPHYVVFCREKDLPVQTGQNARDPALAVGVAFSAPLPVEQVGRIEHVMQVAESVRQAMSRATIADPRDVHFVQMKCPCVTVACMEKARAAGREPVTSDPNRSMAYARAAGAIGVGVALGEIDPATLKEPALLSDFGLYSSRASVSSGVEVTCNEVIVLGNSAAWSGPYRIAHVPMTDALDIGAVYAVLDQLGLNALPQLHARELSRIAGVFVKCEPDRRGRVRGNRHTMLDDTDINAQRHIRGALGGMVSSVFGDGRIFVSGGAEHQGPDGGGLIAVIAGGADSRPRVEDMSAAPDAPLGNEPAGTHT
jgi:cyanuric acid amidohydrolase